MKYTHKITINVLEFNLLTNLKFMPCFVINIK